MMLLPPPPEDWEDCNIGPTLAMTCRGSHGLHIGPFGRVLGPTYRSQRDFLPRDWAYMDRVRKAWLAVGRGNTEPTSSSSAT